VNAIEIPGKPASDDPDEEFFEPIETTIADHHRLLLSKLDEVSNTRHGRMMVFMPPGSAKSTYASVVFPSKFLGEQPGRKVILASYADSLARKMGRRTRQIVRSKRYKGIWGCELSHESSAANEWSLTNGSEYMSCGILSGITGNRAHGIILDDPIKGREQADSETIRAKTWDAYEDDLKTRLIPGGWIVIIQTRWHEDDLSGRILPDDWDGESGKILCKDGNVWEIVCLQAQCDVDNDPLGRKRGEYLWPQWFDERHWAQFKHNRRTWSALYQQKPTASDGTFFKREWFRRYRKGSEPKSLHKYLTSDHAPAGEDKSDFTCVRVWGVDPEGDLYMLDGFRHQEKLDETADKVIGKKSEGKLGLIKRHKPFCWFPEDDNNWKSAAGFITRMMRAEGTFCRIEPISPHGSDKAAKAQAFQAMAASGRVWIQEGPEGDDVIDQYIKFPGGKNDDEVDAAAIIGRALDQAHPAIAPPQQSKTKRDSWDRAFNDDEDDDSWKTV
jgi:predicted phage terminase large subunit-like protein